MNIFTDYHHGDLYYSLHLLFEGRLGFNLYRPIGHDWYDNGYWRIAEPYGNAEDTINQYLDINDNGWDSHKNLNGNHYSHEGVYYCYDPGHNYYQKAIIFEAFKSMKFDIVIPSFPLHLETYARLRRKFQPTAKLVAHLGNAGETTNIQNIIYSIPYVPNKNQNSVFVHQELDFSAYAYTPPNMSTRNIYSFVNCFQYPEIYSLYKSNIPDVNFKYYGSGCPDGVLDGSYGVGEKIREANIGWQLKKLGGLGHTAMGWFYSGRPVITNMSENIRSGGDALLLFEPGVTCLDIEAHSFDNNKRLIYEMLEHNDIWAARVRQRFFEVVNYDLEEQAVRKFLENLI